MRLLVACEESGVVRDAFAAAGISAHVPVVESLVGLHLAPEPAHNFDEAKQTDEALYARRIAACINACAYADTETLIRAVEMTRAERAPWLLFFVNAKRLKPEHRERIQTVLAAMEREA